MYGCQCPKRFYLHKFKRDVRNPEDEIQTSIFASGTDIGVLAQGLFPGGVNAEPPDPFSFHISVDKTKKLIEAGCQTIYEAAFIFEGVLCAIDMLVKQNGHWYGYEVKGSTKVKEPFVLDASLQHFVITNSGLPLADISIIHLNNQYVRIGDIDVQQLFKVESVRNAALENERFINDKIAELKILLRNNQQPIVPTGDHCFNPYECSFTGYCGAEVIREPSTLPRNVDRDAIREFLDQWEFPLSFFDFETIMPGVPEFDHSRPYQQIPFQYSIHKIRDLDSSIEHFEFLGDGITDPRVPLVQKLLSDLGTEGSIVVWNKTFEITRLRELARDFPQFADDIFAVTERIVDLMVPFRRKLYYIPEFNESASLKAVLPALIPELSYEALEIQDGGTASLVYSQLKELSPEEQMLQRNHLLAYCGLDTLAMVEIYKILLGVL